MRTTLNEKDRLASQSALYRELVTLNEVLDDERQAVQIRGKMTSLTKQAIKKVTATSDSEKLDQLLEFFYQDQAFQSDLHEIIYSRLMDLYTVLECKCGLPHSLAALLLKLAAKFEIPIYPVCLPSQLLLRAELRLENGKCETRFVDPWDGRYLSNRDLENILEAEYGRWMGVDLRALRIATEEETIQQLTGAVKLSLTQEHRVGDILRIVAYHLRQRPDDPYLIRERAGILMSLFCFQAAADDFHYFIEKCPDDPSIEAIKEDLYFLEMHARQEIIH